MWSKKIFVCVFAVCAVNTSFSDEYSIAYSVGAKVSYDDNIDGARDNPTSATANIVSPAVKFIRATETSNTNLGLNLDFYRYNRAGYDTDNQNANLNHRWQYTETQNISFDAQIIRDSTLTSDAQIEDTGVINFERNSERRISKRFSPTWVWQFSELNRFSLGYGYSEVDYGNATSYTGNQSQNITPALIRQLGEDWSVFVQADYSVSETDERALNGSFAQLILNGPYARYSTETTTKGLAIGSEYQISENWNLSGYIGKNKTDGEYDVLADPYFAENCKAANPFFDSLSECRVLNSFTDYSDNGAYANVSLKWAQEVWDVTTSYSSNVMPSSEGYSQRSDRLALRVNHKFTERQSINAGLVYVENSIVDKNAEGRLGANQDREITIINVNWQYKLTEDWALTASYVQDKTEYPSGNDARDYTIKSDLFVLGVQWQPKQISWSK